MVSSEQSDEVCDARKDDSSTKAGNQIKIINKSLWLNQKSKFIPIAIGIFFFAEENKTPTRNGSSAGV